MKKFKYIIQIYIQKWDVNGNVESETIEYEFNSGNLLADREQAIKKTKEIQATIDDYLPEGQSFSSSFEAKMKNYKDFNCYSINISLMDDKDFYQIYGEEFEEIIDNLIFEAGLLKQLYPSIKLKAVEYEGTKELILKKDSSFLLPIKIRNIDFMDLLS